MNLRTRIVTFATVALMAVGSDYAFGATTRDPAGPTPPRVSLVDGAVSFWRVGAEDWAAAKVNTALAEGDQLYVADRGNVELQIGSRAFVRAGADTQIGLEGLDVDGMQYKVTGGHAVFDLKRLPSGQVIEIDTPRAAFTIDRPGYYRVDVEEQRTIFSVRRDGHASVVVESGDELEVGPDEQLVLSDDNPTFGVTPVAALDDWDRWNNERTASFAETPRSAQYVSQQVAGIDELDRYGEWHEEPRYGRVWRPRDVGPDWSPYSTGRWQYDPYYEWTWVDDAPWGWAPYHYGRWVYANSYWGWAPGPIVVQPAYAPALVAFFGAPGVSVSVNVGAPFVSWCPLGWGEPVIPWWGGVGFVGRPYWGGWGGPRVINNVVVNNFYGGGGRYGGGRYYDARRINRWQNAMVHNAVVGLDRDRFRRGERPVRLQHARDLRPLRGDIGVRPAAHSFVPNDGRGRRPPERLQHRSVVATRAARNPAQRLRAKGIDVANAAAASPRQRIVHPRGGANRMANRGPESRPNARALGAEHGQRGFDRDRGRAAVDQRAFRHDQSPGTPPRAGRGRERMDARSGRAAPESPRTMARERGRARGVAPTPPRRPDSQGLGHAAPTRPEQSRNASRGRRFEATPAPRMRPQNEVRGGRGAAPRTDSFTHRPQQPERRVLRAEPQRRAPMTRTERPRPEQRQAPASRNQRPRFEHQRTAPQERSMRRTPAPERNVRRAPAQSFAGERAMRSRPAPDRGRVMPRQAPRTERQVHRGAPRQQNGRGRGHQREG